MTEHSPDPAKARSDRRRRIAGSAVGAAAIYGAWALFANLSHGVPIAARAACVQAVWSAALTTLLSIAMEQFAGRLASRGRSIWWLCVPGLLLIYCAPLVHLVNGTPHILRTVAPSLIIGSAFIIGYASRLRSVMKKGTPLS